MTDENICYAIGCTNSGPKRCSACRWVHYCSSECQKTDWKRQGHKQNCAKYQRISAVRQAGDPRGPEGLIAVIELREGRIPLAWALEHEGTARVVTQGILDTGYKITENGSGRRLTHEINETELTHVEHREIVLTYLSDWLSNLAMTNTAQLERSLAKSEPNCHECGKEGDSVAAVNDDGLMPDRRWAFTKQLCGDCFTRTRPQRAPDKTQFKWQIVAYDGPAEYPASWKL